MAKGMFDKVGPQDCCTNDQAASSLAQGHPKAKPAPVAFGMRDRTNDGDGADDNARLPSFASK